METFGKPSPAKVEEGAQADLGILITGHIRRRGPRQRSTVSNRSGVVSTLDAVGRRSPKCA